MRTCRKTLLRCIDSDLSRLAVALLTPDPEDAVIATGDDVGIVLRVVASSVDKGWVWEDLQSSAVWGV